jgi:hypothetical protein
VNGSDLRVVSFFGLFVEDQNERGALTILDGRLYVPFGGHFGDCGDYHGWVVGFALTDPREIVAWATPRGTKAAAEEKR